MILYNVTVSLDPSVHEEWLGWMKSTHVPQMMATGCFTEGRISQIQETEEGGLTFAMGYVCESQEKFDEYEQKYAAGLRQDFNAKYNGKFAAFRTMLTILEYFKVLV